MRTEYEAFDDATPEHYSSDNYPVTVGAKFWNNDLRVCEITQVAKYANDYLGKYTQTWHRTTNGDFDTLDGEPRRIGRLARYYGGKDAEAFPAGTNYADVKSV